MLILSGDRDAFQLVTERLHRALPDARRLGAGADDARRGRGALRRDAPSATPTWRRSSARPPTTCPACPGVGPGFAARWLKEYDGLDGVDRPRRQDHRQEGRGAARAPRRRHPQPPAQRSWSATSTSSWRRPTSRPSPGTGSWCTRSSTPWSSGCCASGCWSRGTCSTPTSTTPASSSPARCSAPARWPTGSTEHAGARDPHRPHRPRRLGRRHRRGARAGARGGRRSGGVDRRHRGHARGRRRDRWRGSATPPAPRCSTTPRARCWPWPRAAGRCRGWSATPRSRRTSCDPTSAPTTWPT